MTAPMPASIVIPTHNRAASVLAALEALERQDCGAAAFEVIVVPNGCSDDTVARLRTRHSALRLQVVSLEHASASDARNAGAAAACGALVIFLDDDITPDRGFVHAHLAAHGARGGHAAGTSDRVAIGYLPASLQPERDRFAIVLRGWWEAMFDRMREPGHRFGYTDLLSGNFSMSRERFLALGGFDPSLACHEDYELGYRLIRAGATFVFVEQASGRHDDRTRLPGACRRKREEGRADVRLAQLYPELRSVLPIAHASTPKQRTIRWLAFHWPAAGDRLAMLLAGTLPGLERAGMVMAWLRVLYAVFGYWYARGLADALPTHAALQRMMEGAWRHELSAADDIDVDLAGGIDDALRRVDATRPMKVTLRVGSTVVGHVPYLPGTERIRSCHAAAALARLWHRPAFVALRAAGAIRLARAGPSGTDRPAHEPASLGG